MEDCMNARSAEPASLSESTRSDSDVVHLHHPVLAAREDVEDEIMLHFNDPNWDFGAEAGTVSMLPDGHERPEQPQRHSLAKPSGVDGSTDIELQISSGLTGVPESRGDLSPKSIQFQDSPYPEVRSAVANTDDPTIVVSTFRVWFIGLIFALIVPSFNTIFSFRSPFVFINDLVVQVLTLPFGKFLEWALPKYRLTVFGHLISLNPGPFNIKEHALIVIMINASLYGTMVLDITGAMRILYGVEWSIGKQFFLGVPFQLLGLSFAGFLRRFLVWPSSMIWPGVLVRCALLNTMHSNYYGEQDAKSTGISRERFLYMACACSFTYYWFPGYIWTGLSVFNWACWIAPNNVVVNSLFGSVSGLGMGLITFDWAEISITGSPLVVPWWTQVNMMAGLLLVVWLLCPILWVKNIFFSQFMPMSVPLPFDNTGSQYNFSEIITNNTFDQAKYEKYSPMFLPITYAVSYGSIFAAPQHNEETDIHAHLMRKYPEVSHWWSIALGVISCILGVIAIHVCDIGLSVWAYLFAIIFAVIFMLPFGIIEATTNQQVYVSVLLEFILGYIMPGHPIATMAAKTIASDTISHALSFSSDLKFGHYLKLPPRLVFSAQLVASLASSFSSNLAQKWAMDNIPDICSTRQKDLFTCPNLNLFTTATIIWGGIGSARFFSAGALYNSLLWFFLIGAILPIPFYFLARRYPRSAWRYVHIPVVLYSAGCVPPATGINFTAPLIVGFIFQWYMRRSHLQWWIRYNYLLSAGLDFGVYSGLVLIFFALQLPKGGIELNWWGNSVWQQTADARMIPLKALAPGETFGPSSWS
ncbi:OPT-domain-containing protein [Lactarius quietus]|nr:OPT-domain-containing protein [Lactarius quietus]